MGENVNSTVIAVRVAHETAAALMRMSEERGITMNSMMRVMLERRVTEIREKEGW